MNSLLIFSILLSAQFSYEQHVEPTPATPTPTETAPTSSALFLEENIGNGFEIRLSDGSLWEVAPQDRDKAALWLGPVEVRMIPSDDPEYTCKMVNVYTKSSLLVRPIVFSMN